MDFRDTPDYRGSAQIGTDVALISISTLVFCLRVFVRVFVTKSFGLDDGLAAAAYLSLVALSALDLSTVAFGSGTHMSFVPEDALHRYFELLNVQSVLYFWVMALVRAAILAFIPRIAQERCVNQVAWALAGIIAAQVIGATVYKLTECASFEDNFRSPALPGLNCVGTATRNKMMIGHDTIGIILDFILVFLPMWIICKRMMWSKKMVQIILVLSVGIFALATGVIRVILLATVNLPVDITWKMPSIGIWTSLEAHVGLWCGCFPALQAIVRAVMPKAKTRAVSTMYHNHNSMHARYMAGAHDKHGTARREYETSANRPYEMLNESQRAIITPVVSKEDAASRDGSGLAV
ncbi:hypothetical protein GGR52DRAFT_575649 [Hypoxylon sp. FL1284]|nr:hypothetical protein GGR52DRAFT_575649 [Hypoxylon sp. FL1284]